MQGGENRQFCLLFQRDKLLSCLPERNLVPTSVARAKMTIGWQYGCEPLLLSCKCHAVFRVDYQCRAALENLGSGLHDRAGVWSTASDSSDAMIVTQAMIRRAEDTSTERLYRILVYCVEATCGSITSLRMYLRPALRKSGSEQRSGNVNCPGPELGGWLSNAAVPS